MFEGEVILSNRSGELGRLKQGRRSQCKRPSVTGVDNCTQWPWDAVNGLVEWAPMSP